MLHYIDSDFLKPVFSCLVIKVSSIVEHFQSLENFSNTYNFGGETNGTLLIAAQMCTPAFELETFAVDVLIPNGMKLNEDFAFIDEKLIEGVEGTRSYKVNIEHPDCENTPWLKGMIISKGNYIWYSDPGLSDFERDANFRLFMLLCYTRPEQFNLNPRIIRIDDTYVHYTISGLDMYYKKHRDGLWYNEKVYGKRNELKKN